MFKSPKLLLLVPALVVLVVLLTLFIILNNREPFTLKSVNPASEGVIVVDRATVVRFKFNKPLAGNLADVRVYPTLSHAVSVEDSMLVLSLSDFPLVDNELYVITLYGVESEEGNVIDVLGTSFVATLSDSVVAFSKTLPIIEATYTIVRLADNNLLVDPSVGTYFTGASAALDLLESNGVDPVVYKVTVSQNENLKDPTGGANPHDNLEE